MDTAMVTGGLSVPCLSFGPEIRGSPPGHLQEHSFRTKRWARIPVTDEVINEARIPISANRTDSRNAVRFCVQGGSTRLACLRTFRQFLPSPYLESLPPMMTFGSCRYRAQHPANVQNPAVVLTWDWINAGEDVQLGPQQ